MIKSVQDIKKAQRESLLLREIAQLLLEKAVDDPELAHVFVNRVSLSRDKGICSVYFFSTLGREEFDRVFDRLKLYKPSLRKALADRVPGRYTPQIVFKYDDQLKKQLAIEELIEKVTRQDAKKTE